MGFIKFIKKKLKSLIKVFFYIISLKEIKMTVDEIDKKTNLDNSIIRSLIVKYKKLDTESEFLKKKNNEKKK